MKPNIKFIWADINFVGQYAISLYELILIPAPPKKILKRSEKKNFKKEEVEEKEGKGRKGRRRRKRNEIIKMNTRLKKKSKMKKSIRPG